MADTASSDALWRWIFGGFAVGAVVLGLLVAAYVIGYDRGQDSSAREAAAGSGLVTSEETTTPSATGTAPSTGGPDAAGEELWTSTGCAGCHSIDGSASVGPTVKGLAGSPVELDDGTTVTADDAYLALSITDADAQIVAGFQAGVMSGAVASHDFGTRPEDVEALVEYMKAQR